MIKVIRRSGIIILLLVVFFTVLGFANLSSAVLAQSPPEVIVGPTDQLITYGNNAMFYASAKGEPPITVQWQVSSDGGATFSNIIGETNNTLIVTRPTLAHSGYKYRAVFHNGGGNTSTVAATLVVVAVIATPSITANNKTYDGTTKATLSSATLSGVISLDDVTLDTTSATIAFADKSAGNSKTVTANRLTLRGTDKGNYVLSSTTANATAYIWTKELTVTGITACDKVYNARTNATLDTNNATLVGVIPGDNVTLNTSNATGIFTDSSVGMGQTVIISGLTISGTDIGNYSLTQPTTWADIWAIVDVELEPGTTQVSQFITTDGEFTRMVAISSNDDNVGVIIKRETVGLTVTGSPLSFLSITPMAKPPSPPVGNNVIGLAYDFGPQGANFSQVVTITFNYNPAQLPAGANENNLTIAAWDSVTSLWITLPSTVKPIKHTVTAPVAHFSLYELLIPITRPASFSASNLSISPSTVDIGEPVTIAVIITNTGDLTGSYTLTLKINNTQIDTKNVTLAGKVSQTVSFTTPINASGVYNVDVNGLVGSFTVKTAPSPTPTATPTPTPTSTPTPTPTLTPTPTPSPINWELIGSIIIAIMVVVGVTLVFRSLRRILKKTSTKKG